MLQGVGSYMPAGSLMQAQALLGSSLNPGGGLLLPALGSSVNPFVGLTNPRGAVGGPYGAPFGTVGVDPSSQGLGLRPQGNGDSLSSDADEPMATEEGTGGTPGAGGARSGGPHGGSGPDAASDWDPLFMEELLFEDGGEAAANALGDAHICNLMDCRGRCLELGLAV